MDNGVRRMKRQMLDALREENEELEEQLSVLRGREAARIEQVITTGSHAIAGLLLAIQALARVTPNTAAGRAALEKVRSLCEHHGVPLPAALQKVPKPKKRKRRKAKKSSSTRPLTTRPY